LVSKKELRSTNAILYRKMKMTRMLRMERERLGACATTGAASYADGEAAAFDTAAPEEAESAAKAAQA
jgi:hypothetical protein